MLGIEDFRASCRRAAEAMRQAEDELNGADARLGDGDTGQTVRRVAEAMQQAAEAAASDADLDAFLRRLGMAGMSATGSSLGTLISLGVIEMGKSFKGRQTVTPEDIAAALAAAEAAMLARGKTELGDKTALDVLHAIRGHLESNASDGAGARAAAQAALVAFRDRPCRAGRARMYGDKSIGIDDPGMLAFARLADAIATS